MRRDFSKKYYSDRNRETAASKRRVVLLVGIAILIGAVSLVTYEYKKQPQRFPVASANLSRLSAWLTHRQEQPVAAVEKAKSVIAQEEAAEKQIHFEFYTALPNMRMPAPKPAEAQEKPLHLSKEVAATPAFVSPEELERDFSKQVTQAYVVQLGVFNNTEAANGYRQSLQRAGFKVDIAKITMAGKTAYRVQFGPFASKDQARVVMKQLQKKGVVGLVRKAV